MPIKRAIKKYGKENFIIELIEECDLINLDKQEIYWISFYDTYKSKKGYNCSKGGEGGSNPKLNLEQELEIIKLRKENNSLLVISKRYNIDKTTVSNIMKRHGEKSFSKRNLSYRVDLNQFIKDVDSKKAVKELMNIYNIKYTSVYNLIKKYNIENNTSKSVHFLPSNRGRKCTLTYINDKDIELKDKELLG